MRKHYIRFFPSFQRYRVKKRLVFTFADKFATVWSSLHLIVMGGIHVLSSALRDQIAAGEVVERPASIVKELIENALDAGATEIDIEIEDGGLRKIAVRDNGSGMDSDDLVLALTRYATSKISSFDDLSSIRSYGFRGEALASIASVSRCRIRTKTESSPFALEVTSEEPHSPTTTSSPRGTEVIVEDLFSTVPARKKFLKSIGTETSHITEIIENYALVHFEKSFRFRVNKRVIMNVSGQKGDGAFHKRTAALFGNDFSEQLLPAAYLGETMKISGFVSHPHVHRRNRKNQRIFINSRPVSDRIVSSAISRAYETLIPKGTHADAVLLIDMRPDLVDVNVHPRKSEVKFRDERELFQTVFHAVERALQPKWDKPGAVVGLHDQCGEGEKILVIPPIHESFSRQTGREGGERNSQKLIRDAILFSQDFLGTRRMGKQSESEESSCPDLSGNNSTIIIGQLRNSFILIEEEDGLRIVDQHAAHEGIRFHRLRENLRLKKNESQKLLVPQVMSISRSEKILLESYRTTFEGLGFEIDEFSENEISLFSVPLGLEKVDFRKMLESLLDDLGSSTPGKKNALAEGEEKIISYAACRGAVKFGDPLTQEEMEKLVGDLDASEHGYSCAHGRPVSMTISYREMEKKCGR